jgi:YidC/Oxa1 family membrane protein insertase
MGMVGQNPNQNDTQKNILIAVVISFLFFIVYDILYLQPQQVSTNTKTSNQQNQQNVSNNTSQPTPNTNNLKINSSTPSTQNLTKTQILSTIKTKNAIFEIDDLGRISQVTLLHKQYKTKDGKAIKLFKNQQLKPLEVRFANPTLNNEAFKTKVNVSSANIDATASKQILIITQKLSTTTLTKKITFYPDGHYDLDISTSTNEQYFLTPGYRPDVIADRYADHGVLMIKNDNTLVVIEDGHLEKNEDSVGIQAVSSFDRYYATVLYNFNKNLTVSVLSNQKNPEAFIHIQKQAHFSGYAGAKEYDLLNSLHYRLTGIIEYGWFTFIAKPMFALMKFIYNIIGNWGWTIVVVTILVKLVLFPLSYKGMMSMSKLKKLSPKIKHIQEKYKNDKQKMSMHMMELYQKEGANPMGGCLPMLLQVPVFFAIYRDLINAIELKGSAWILWINDLSVMDPYYVLPILMGITMYVQQKITPQQIQDETQKKIFEWLPVIFTVFFLWFPAGLTLYWFVNNLFTVAQQYYINKVFEAKELAKKEAKK